GESRAARPVVPVAAVRLLVHGARQRHRRRGAACEARPRHRDRARGLGRRMNPTKTVRAACIAAFAVGLAMASAAAETVRVGVVASYSGPGAEVGRDLDRGMALYRKLYPDAFGGHTVQLVRRAGPSGFDGRLAGIPARTP